MELGRVLRTLVPPIVLSAFALGAWQAANRADFGAVGGEDFAYDLTIQTPAFSARRLPITLRAPINESAVEPAVIEAAASAAEALEGTDGVACLLVVDAERTIGPVSEPAGGVVPASNQKLLSTYAGLGLLGTEFTFTTRVMASGPAIEGVVTDLYLVGSGDPFLFTEDWINQYDDKTGRHYTRLEDLADAVAAAGIVEVSGTLLGDETLFDDARVVEAWHPRLVAQKQSGPLSALTVNEGFVDWPEVYQQSARPRSETDNPPLHAVSVFGQLLAERGVQVAATGVGATPPSALEVASIDSPRLTEIVTHINSFSSNIGAELVTKRLGVEHSGQGTTAAGARAIVDYLIEQGIPTNDLVVEDGSGLAESNRLTCAALVAILTSTGPESEFGRSLSIAGERGSLTERFVDSPADGQILAKTGTLRGVRALAGFAESINDDNAHLTFALIVNDEVLDDEPLAIQDTLLGHLVTFPAGPAVEVLAPLPAATAG